MAEGPVMTRADPPLPTTPNGAEIEESGHCDTPAPPTDEPTPTSAPVAPRNNVDVDMTVVIESTKSRNKTPKRNPSTGSMRSGPLPSMEECLFGMPKNLDQLRDCDDDEDTHYFVPLNLLRRVSSQGIDDDDDKAGSHRGLAWRLLLGMLPADRRNWDAAAERQRKSYHTFVHELFCLEDRDIDGSELRGHISKKVSENRMTRKEKKERRKRNSKSQNGEGDIDGVPATRCPIKFVEEPQSTATATDGELVAGASGPKDDETDVEEESKQRNDQLESSISDLLKDDPALWNMSVREQKILERLTNHEAVNQLLVKHDCKEWNNFLENATLLDEIRKDVNRTHPHLYFYLEPSDQLGQRRYGALERILFVWAKLNKGVRYVQGMNEIVGTLYYVLANDLNEYWADHAESDTYILFNVIMSEMRDIFVADMDTADTGIVGRISNMQNLLHLHDPQVKAHLVEMGIDASFYAVRWLTTLLSREFLLPDTIRLWDSMFASTHKENFLRYVCVTMVLNIRDQLLLADFATCLQLLQKYPSTSMDDLLDASRALWIYESQITMACLKGGLTLHQALQAIPPPERVIMAFGLRGGVALTNREQLEQARVVVKNNVNKGMQTLSTASQGILGGARRFLQERIKRSKSMEKPVHRVQEEEERTSEEAPSKDQQRKPFRNFTFGARSHSEGNEERLEDLTKGEDDLAIGAVVPSCVSDAETI